jgi:argonaute-like protein implicated in RNA metabolism and viral defense
MLSLEQAIEHADDISISAIGCECREEHRQLVDWLRELQERRKAPEIIFCHECRYWKDSDGVYRRGINAESKCPVNSRQVYEGTFFCGMAERRTE